MSVAVVVCTYSEARFEAMRETLAAVLRQLAPQDEVVVVIDHNEPLRQLVEASLAAADDPAERWRDGRVHVAGNQNAKGLSGARNTGVSVAQADVIVFLDDDAVPRDGWLTNLIEAFSDPGVIGAGGAAIPAWDGAQPWWMPDEFLWVVGCTYRGVPMRPVEIRNPIGANMAFRREAILQAGGFTDGIGRVGRTPLGCEETELSIRATRVTGGRILQQPIAAVDHRVTADRRRVAYFVRRCWAEGLSKAAIARLVGGDAGSATERTYTLRVLPSGVLRGLRDGLRGDRRGLARASTIIGGLAVTSGGYVRGRLGRIRPAQRTL